MVTIPELVNNKGIGSFFPYIDLTTLKLKLPSSDFSPKNKLLFYTGRQAIKYVIEAIKLNRKIGTIWLPEYYCQHVTSWIIMNYINIKRYPVNPKNSQETVQVINFAKDDDIVLVNNFWGTAGCKIDRGYKSSIIIIEDHSHGWLSESCINSSADYCIASLRKSVSTPLGGIAWRPNGKEIDSNVQITDDLSYHDIWNNILKGMILKSTYEENFKINEEEKSFFLDIINNEEQRMHTNLNLVPLAKNHEHIIEEFIQTDFLSLKKENLKVIYSQLIPSKNFELIKDSHPSFGVILYLDNESNMKYLRSYLIAYNIYPSHLWPGNDKKYGFYLNIHIDYRYNLATMEYICAVLNNFKPT